MARPTQQQRRERQQAFAPAKVCHSKQAAFVLACTSGTSRNICCLAGRQSGKSYGAVMGALLLALIHPGCNVLYVTSTYGSCKRFAYKPAVEMNRAFCLGGKTNDSEQSITFPNGATVYFLGADKDNTIGRLRGTPNLVACFIDEAGVYSTDALKSMLETVRPGLRPRAGKLILLGTPSLQGKQGTWYDATQNSEYAQHYFTYRDNDRVPSFAKVEELIDEDLRAQGVTRESAYFKREYLGLFEVELAERVYQLGDANLYDTLPTDLHTYVVGGDLGSSANDALVTIGWRDDSLDVWVVDERKVAGQDSLAFADMAKAVYDTYQPIAFPVDPGGLGQKTIGTVQRLFPTIPITEAVKPHVAIQVRAVNLLLQSGRLKVRRGSELAQDLASPTWVGGMVGGKIDEHGLHSDLAPALRYACIAATPLIPSAPAQQAPPQTLQERYLAQELAQARLSSTDREAASLGVRFDDDASDGVWRPFDDAW